MSRHRRPRRHPLRRVAAWGDERLLWSMCVGALTAFVMLSAPAGGTPVAAMSTGPAFTAPTSNLKRATRAWTPPPQPLWERAVAVALAQVGKPYVWGAKGPNAFDCSGLVQWAWRQAGVQLEPGTYGQVRQGHPVPTPQPGDLVFPAAEMGPRGPGHVVLAISTTQAVEAPGRGMTVRVIPMPPGVVRRVI